MGLLVATNEVRGKRLRLLFGFLEASEHPLTVCQGVSLTSLRRPDLETRVAFALSWKLVGLATL